MSNYLNFSSFGKLNNMEFKIKTTRREEIVDITERVKEAVCKILEKDGKMVCNKKAQACLVYVPHASCSLIINENYDSAVCEDILDFLRKIIPRGKWKHDKQDGNGDSHIKSALLGPSKTVPLEDGKLCLGTWQSIGLAEFDGPRDRRVIVKII